MQRKTQREREITRETISKGEKMQPSVKVKDTVEPVMFRIRMTARLV